MKTCYIDGCDKRSVSKGLCDTHRKRVERHGDATVGRPENWGEAATHPLYDTWQWMKHNHHMKAWADFWEFVKDVGERPSPRHMLSRKNVRFGYDKDNFFWRAPKFDEPIIADSKQAYHNAYRKKWEKEDPRYWKNMYLKQAYGITIEDFDRMLAEQNGVCAICLEPEKVTEKGKLRALHVDHNKETGAVRGLLCHSCNTSIGHFKHSIALLEAAIAYLRKHS